MSEHFLRSLRLLANTGFAPPSISLPCGSRELLTNAPASNLSPAAIGQAKHMAAMALEALEDELPATEYDALEAAVAEVVDLTPFELPPGFHPAPPPPGYVPVGNRVLLVGQLKALAQPFYDHLRAWDRSWLDNEMTSAKLRVVEPGSNPPEFSPYPWSVATSDDQNYAIATLGQLKAVFSLRLGDLVDTDGDQLPDAWEVQYGLDPLDDGSDNPGNGADGDPDNDGLSNLQEYQNGTDPMNPDTDGDLLLDGWESQFGDGSNGLDPLQANPNAWSADWDSDGFSNLLESIYGSDPFDSSSHPPSEPADPPIVIHPPYPPDEPEIITPPPPPSITGTGWHLVVDESSKTLSKYGYAEFIPSAPPKRYLKLSETVAFELTGDDGDPPESPINGTKTTTIDPLTGEETVVDGQHDGNNNMGGATEAITRHHGGIHNGS